MGIKIKDLVKSYNNEKIILDNINLEIEDGEFVCLLGSSGCGKSTLLNIIAAFEKPTSGQVLIDNEEVKKPSIERMSIFQNYGLLPWRTVEKNIHLGLETLKLSKKEIKNRTDELLDLVNLKEHSHKFPYELSGGQQQRVGIARALAVKPKILFMDEPFGALDPITRRTLQDELIEIWKREKTTIIFVTHDIEEAIILGSKIVIMEPNPGKIKTIINNKIKKPINKEESDFYDLKEKIFKILEFKSNENIEYFI